MFRQVGQIQGNNLIVNHHVFLYPFSSSVFVHIWFPHFNCSFCTVDFRSFFFTLCTLSSLKTKWKRQQKYYFYCTKCVRWFFGLLQNRGYTSSCGWILWYTKEIICQIFLLSMSDMIGIMRPVLPLLIALHWAIALSLIIFKLSKSFFCEASSADSVEAVWNASEPYCWNFLISSSVLSNIISFVILATTLFRVFRILRISSGST